VRPKSDDLHDLLRFDGTVQGFANSSQFPFGNDAEPPESLANVIAVAGGGALPHHGPQFNFQIALKGDGSVVTWGAPLGLPDDLTDLVEVAAGGRKILFLRGNGTLAGISRYSPSVSLEWNLPPGIRDVSAIAVGGYHVLAIAPPMPEWYTPFRTWMQERGWTAWAEDPDQNGSNHWEDWVFARDLGTHQTLDAFMASDAYLPGSFFPVVRLVWRSEAPKPIVQWSADLRTWGETEKDIETTYYGQPPPPGLFSGEYHYPPLPTSPPPPSEYFRVLPP